MRKTFAFPQCQRLGGRFEGAWNGFVINGFPTRSERSGRKRQVADGDALEVSELAILFQGLDLRHDWATIAYIWQEPWPLAGNPRCKLAGGLRLIVVDHDYVACRGGPGGRVRKVSRLRWIGACCRIWIDALQVREQVMVEHAELSGRSRARGPVVLEHAEVQGFRGPSAAIHCIFCISHHFRPASIGIASFLWPCLAHSPGCGTGLRLRPSPSHALTVPARCSIRCWKKE